MDQHPVPRNITGFQFRLVGDMTMRQFGYLAGGCIIAFFIFKSVPLPSFLKLFFAGTFALAGFLFAFLPIQERPLDKWIVLFIRSIYAPTQFLWQKEGILPSVLMMPSTSHITLLPANHAAAHEDAKQKLRSYLANLPATPHQTLNLKEKYYLDKTLSLFSSPLPVSTLHAAPPSPQLQPVQVNVPVPTPTPPPAPITPPIPPSTPPPSPAITPPVEEKHLETTVSPTTKAAYDFEILNKRMLELSAQKDMLTKELDRLRKANEKPNDSVVVKPTIVQDAQPTIKSVTAKNAVEELGMPNIPEYPNLIIGAIKDGERKVLPNILITIKDKNGIPLRALKTNKLGHFAAATPLPNGLYFIEVEDPLKRFTFDIAEVTLSGKIFLPIEITAKSQKEIMREQLSKALFSNPTA